MFGANEIANKLSGSAAAWCQANIGVGVVFSYLQSAAMGGYGTAVVQGVSVTVGGAVGAVAGYLIGR
jgi:hypothetical protein